MLLIRALTWESSWVRYKSLPDFVLLGEMQGKILLSYNLIIILCYLHGIWFLVRTLTHDVYMHLFQLATHIYISRLTIVSHEAKKKQAICNEQVSYYR